MLTVPVNFDFIDDPACRRRFRNMATSWTLPVKSIDTLLAAGEALAVAGLTAAPRDHSRPSAAARLGLKVASGPILATACETTAQAD